ncbi:MAG: transglycosylase SLT domain-containing protein [Bdellovibrionales bacterium]|nr:transglycosylase SLT domain-containing protein [Bdellovibrionales bacterium]
MAEAQPHKVTLTEADQWPQPRWMHDGSSSVTGPVRILYLAKKAESEEKFKTCLSQLSKAEKRFQNIQPWIAHLRLQCGRLEVKKDSESLRNLWETTEWVRQNPQWLTGSPYSASLREEYLEGLMSVAEGYAQSTPERAWTAVENLLALFEFLSTSEKAKILKLAGDVAQQLKNPRGALAYYQRSLDQEYETALAVKVQSLRKKLLIPEVPSSSDGQPSMTADASTPAEKELAQLLERMKKWGRKGDHVAAIVDGVRLLRQYPASPQAEIASNQVSESLKVVVKGGAQSKIEKVLRELKKCDGDNLNRWALRLFAQREYELAEKLAEASAEKLETAGQGARTLLLIAKGFVTEGEYNQAIKIYTRISDNYPGKDWAHEARYRLGLVKFRQQKYDEAKPLFEGYLANPNREEFRLSAMHWLWRSELELKSEKAATVAQQLVKEYPLTYYGLRARAELNGGQLEWSDETHAPLKAEMWLTDSEQQSFDRFKLLLQAGWLKAAQTELRSLPDPLSAEERLLRARLFAASMDYFTAIQWTQKSWEDNPGLRVKRFLPLVFPKEFSNLVETQSEKYEVEPLLVYGLIKQESSFRTNAISPARAMGLMQLMPGTARDVARYNRTGSVQLPDDMFDPEKNVYFGTSYLKRMIRAFDGHVPLALAAYNVGIGNMRRFLRGRDELSELGKKQTSHYLHEVWVDELPWEETSFYVKAIMRNLLVYRMLEQNSVGLADPLWAPVVMQTPLEASHPNDAKPKPGP